MTIKERKQRFDYRRSQRANFEAMWDDVARYTLMVRNPFQTTTTPGAFLNDGSLFANIGVIAARSFASAILGACWRGAELSARLTTSPFIKQKDVSSTDLASLAEDSALWASILDHDDTNLNVALTAAALEFTIYGNGAVSLFPTETFPFAKFDVVPLRNLFLTENDQELFVAQDMSGPEFALRYPGVKLPEATVRKLKDEKSTIKVVQHIFSRPASEREAAGWKSYPFAAVTFLPEELTDTDKEAAVVEESGYAYFPVAVARMNKLPTENYGRGIGMDALPAIMEMNAARELFTLGSEFKVEPTLWSLAGSFNNGTFNKSPGALNIPNLAGAQGVSGAPVGPVHTIGSLQELVVHIEALVTTIKEHFYIDKLFDLNNTSRMTLGEALIRKTLRDDAVSPFYLTIFSKWLRPLLTSHAKRMAEKKLILQAYGKQGDAFARAKQIGVDAFAVDFTSPAARSLKSADLKNYLDLMGVLGNTAQLSPDGVDNYDVDKFTRDLPMMTGTAEKYVRPWNDVLKLRKRRADAAAQAMENEQKEAESSANQKNAQALSQMREETTEPFVDQYNQQY